MQPAGQNSGIRGEESSDLSRPNIARSRADHAIAHALEARLASGRPMSRSLRRAYEQLIARESGNKRQAESTDCDS